MKTLSKFLLASILIISAHTSQAQDYHSAIGIRLGGLTSGVSVKRFINTNTAIEGIGSFGKHSFVITGLYEKHCPLIDSENWNIVYGGGAHVGFFTYNGTYLLYRENGTHVYVTERGATATIPGIDGILGIEYKIPTAPVTIGFDVKPFAEIATGRLHVYPDGAFTARFAF